MTDSLSALVRSAAILLVIASALTGCGGGEGSAPDTGGADAGVVPDASSGDAAIDDGGIGSDAGTSDSGPSDSGPLDAGCPATDTVLAIRLLQWGEGSSGEWRGYGFDLDGLSSTASSTDVCRPNSGGSTSAAYPDGNAGIDNSFGKNVLPTILSIDPTFTSDAQNSLDHGDFTTLLELLCLPPTGDVPVLGARLFDASPRDTVPLWDGTDVWSVDPWLLSDPTDSASTTLLFPASSVTGATFDAGTRGTFVLSVPIRSATGSTFMRLTFHAARVTMTLSGDRTSATSGRLGGVLDTEELVAEVEKVGAILGVCGSSLLDSLLTSIRQASDILADGTQDPSRTCDGISIGLAFEMAPAQRGDVGPMRSAPTCP
jgi:hypothetical protein